MKKQLLRLTIITLAVFYVSKQYPADTRRLSTSAPASTQAISPAEPLTPLHAPLEFVSPSIRAFSPASTPEQDQTAVAPASLQTSDPSKPLPPLQAPLDFVSPSIRAFQAGHGSLLEHQGSPFAYGISGYIKNEAFIDSYQVVGDRQDQYLFFPERPVMDRGGSNIKSKGRFNMLAIESRVRGEVAGPFIYGAQSFGVFEIDAWATSGLSMGLLRIRHAFLYFEWEDKSLMMGQYWHPLMLPECFADTISFNGGTPFEPFTREPQVRLTKQFDNMTFIIAAGAHANSPYDGPYGIDSVYARNGILPNINIQLFSSIRKHLCGIGVDITRLVPRLVTNKDFKAHESIASFIAIAFAAFNWENLGLRLKFIYGQNGNPYGLISGYAVDHIDPYTDERSYTNTQCVNLWLDTAYKGEVEPGLFLGIGKNIGANKKIIPCIINPETNRQESLIYANGWQDIDLLYRVQPRIRWFIKPFVFGAELELTGASYGTVTDTAHVVNTKFVNNLRVLLAAFYVF